MVIPATGECAAIVLVEGEFDGILISQIAGDLVNVVVTGSASNRPDSEVLSFIRQASTILAAYDGDDSGDKHSFHGWIATLPNPTRIYPPRLADGNWPKDVTDSWKGGSDLRRWLKMGICMANKGRASANPRVKQVTDEPKQVTTWQKTVKPHVEIVEPRPELYTSDDIVGQKLVTAAKEVFNVAEAGLPPRGRGVVSGPPEPLMTSDDWRQYDSLPDQRYRSLPDDLRRKMHLGPGEAGYEPAWPYEIKPRPVFRAGRGEMLGQDDEPDA
ncbi:MAG: hypothetical protein HQK57_02225 [Deltaproteobacteria bacterium]|nr:hypothetical protein [Deltaproteobacteria bacterium]